MLKLTLRCFRCFKKQNFIFKKFPLFIVGPNGSGKTSILEAIYLLATSKSFRSNNKKNLIYLKSSQAYLSLDFGRKRLEIFFNRQNPTLYRLDGRKINREKFMNQFLISVFWWGDFKIVYGSPQDRRRFLNLLCVQKKAKYLKWLIIYKKVVKERNFALKKNNIELVKAWDEKLSLVGSKIYQVRRKVIAGLNKKISFYLTFLKTGRGKIVYQGEYFGSKAFFDRLAYFLNKDLILGSTSVGPHRDDLKFFWNDKPLAHFSQGEIKIFLLALKLSYFQANKKSNKLFLLDDGLAGLDQVATRKLINFTKKRKIPLILTSQGLPRDFGGQIITLKQK